MVLSFGMASNFLFNRRKYSICKNLDELYIPMPDGSRISALYGTPKKHSTNQFKAVILVHGFAAEKTENGLFLDAATRLLSDGYLVLAYDWRGLGKSDGDFSKLKLETHVDDFKFITQWLQTKARVSPTEICVIGFSLGAAVVAKAVQRGERVGSAVFLSPATRPAMDMWPRYNTKEIREKLKTQGFIVKQDNNIKLGPEILYSLRDTDLGDRAFNLGIPLLVCHGSNDSRIPVNSSRYCFEAVIEKNVKRVVFAEFSGASHSFKPLKRYRTDLMTLLIGWLRNSAIREGQSKKHIYPQPKRRTLPQVAVKFPRRATQVIARAVGKHTEAAL